MIRSFADVTTADLWTERHSKAARRIPRDLWHSVQRKLTMLDSATTRRSGCGARQSFRSVGGKSEGAAQHPRQPEASSLGPSVHPGEVLLEEFLKPLEMTQAAAAQKLGMSTVRLNEIVRGKRGVTADTALRLAQLFKTTPQFWMHMQANFDLKAAMARRRAMKLAGRS